MAKNQSPKKVNLLFLDREAKADVLVQSKEYQVNHVQSSFSNPPRENIC